MDPFYAVVRVIARFWIWFFFERVEVRHPERVPRMGPVLLCISHPNNLIDPFQLSGSIAEAVEHFREQDPERVERLWQRILGYHTGLAAYRLRDEAVRTRLERMAERQRVARSWQTIVGLPLFAYGAAVNFLPYYLPGWLAGRMSRRQTDYATTRFLASVVAFPFRWALAFFLSLPRGGLIAYRYLVGTGRLRHQLRFGALLVTRAQDARRLLAERREIVEELERAKRDYLGGAKGPSV